MTREEYRRWLADMVRRNIISLDEASALLEQLDDGAIVASELPLPAGEATELEPIDETAIFAYLMLILGYTQFTRRLPLRDRQRLRRRLRDEFEVNMDRLADELIEGGNVAAYQRQAKREMANYTARQYAAGLGEPSGLVTRFLTAASLRNAAFLARLAFEIYARRAVGRPYLVKNVAGRGRMYGGDGWGAWFQGNESQAGEGWVSVYSVRDTGPRLCGPCAEAGRVRYYLPGTGPMPGDVCLGSGFCRCERALEYNVEEYERLTEQPVGVPFGLRPQTQARQQARASPGLFF